MIHTMKTIKLFFLLLFFVAGLASLTSCSDDEPKPTHEYVDLGLPSGTLWATCNVGASAPEEYGDYFAWGETAPKDDYHWNNYKWCKGSYDTMTKYCTQDDYSYGYNDFTDGKTELDPEDDAAYVNWGPQWRMPSMEQQLELVEKCNRTWTSRNGVDGCLFTGPNGNTIFLPAGVYFWSRTLYPNFSCVAFCLSFDSYSGPVDAGHYWFDRYRFQGRPVRAVRVSKN